MEVPEAALKGVLRLSNSSPVGPTASVLAAMMFTPGAVMSGFRIAGSTVFGPLDEKDAIIGAGVVFNIVFTRVI